MSQWKLKRGGFEGNGMPETDFLNLAHPFQKLGRGVRVVELGTCDGSSRQDSAVERSAYDHADLLSRAQGQKFFKGILID